MKKGKPKPALSTIALTGYPCDNPHGLPSPVLLFYFSIVNTFSYG